MRSACPIRGCRSSTKSSTSVPTPLAERAYAPWVDMEAAMRVAGVPLFSVEQHLPAADFDVLAFNLSAELVYTNLLNMIDLAGLPAARRGPGWRRRAGRGRRPLRLQPRAAGRLRRRVRPRRRRGGRRRDQRGRGHLAARLRPQEARPGGATACAGGLDGVYVPALYVPSYENGRLVLDRPDGPGRARRRWQSGRSATWPTGPIPPARSSR